ncbi:ribonuclease P subunit p25 [Paramuricea clavata]|uniref:Ribonuclease P subunit p25 n=1 Tax=Paramuricea clavata TaxID=317549 RepID=A0A7D9EFF0_PARCT|nr:ribonuclease P subunit p25 [Paramuricea clavata]
MENYTRLNSRPVVEDPKEPWDIYVGNGSKVKAVISKALKILEESGEKVVLIGFGPTLNKTITCVEIIKRKKQDLHQNNKLFYKKMEDTWVPNQEGLDRLTVTRNVPAIKIVLSKTPLDENEPG